VGELPHIDSWPDQAPPGQQLNITVVRG